VQGLLTRGDAETTARDILASENTFRLGIVSLFLVIVLDVVVAGALFRVFSPVSRAISMLAASFRIVFARGVPRGRRRARRSPAPPEQRISPSQHGTAR